MTVEQTTEPVSTWLVTGASSGFGRSIVTAALDAGRRVVGATRDVVRARAANPDFEARGGIWLQLDPADRDSSPARFAEAQEKYDVDVLVNNAGYSFIGGIEDTSEDEVRNQFEVNFWGPLRAVRAVLPHMRAKRRGHIVLISSGGVYMRYPGRGAYTASKVAIDALHECLRTEVEEFGIGVLLVQPGAFRTPWASHLKIPAAHEDTAGFSAGYKGTAVERWVGPAQGFREGTALPAPGRAIGDTDKAAREIVRAVVEGHDYLRLMLGSDCVRAAEQRLGELRRDLEATREIAVSADEETPSSGNTEHTTG